MMDGREVILGKAEQEQKEVRLPKAILTPPRDKKNNHQGQQQQRKRTSSSPSTFGIHLRLSEGATIQPRVRMFTEPYTRPGGLLTDADGTAIFHQVRGKRGKTQNPNQRELQAPTGNSAKQDQG